MWGDANDAGNNVDSYQCAVARGEQNYLHQSTNEQLIPDLFLRDDRVLTNGETLEGDLTPGDTLLESGQLIDVYYFSAKADTEITVEVSSDDFDTWLFIEDSEGQIIASDDDGGDSTNSRINILILRDGDYQIGISSYNYSVGKFTVSFAEDNP